MRQKAENNYMETIVLAGGLGTRLRSSIGNEIPKCMAPVANLPFLWYLLKYLSAQNVTHVILSIGYLHDVVFKWIEEVKNDFPFVIDYAVEEEQLGTGGGIKLALSKAKENDVVVVNGDTMFDIDLAKMLSLHMNSNAVISLALKEMKDFDRYGTVAKDVHNKVVEFKEKCPCAVGYINGGVYVINKDNVVWPGYNKFSFEKDVIDLKKNTNVYAFDFDGYFIDIGVPEDYQKANEDFKTLFANF